MVEAIDDMPAGTLGFRARGRLTRSDYSEMLVPGVRRAVETGSVRLLVVVEELEKLELGGRIGQAKVDLGARSGAWERIAVVTDVGWIRASCRPFGFLVPGEIRVFGRDEEGEARGWLAARPA